MPATAAADTIRILVATDNHVGYNERDPIRGDDSWKSFHEIMCLAKKRDVDMVLLAGDLFHENKPSRKSMYNVMRSLRMNCYGDKPCELEMLSDGSEHFDGTFTHANFDDQDINVAIPVFSIHGNHDDPSGEGHFAALDILGVSGLLNYYGRTPESDNIKVKPVLMQKGRTKLALYGLSNVRDERLYRTFRDKKVKFFQPGQQTGDWFSMICVHQNHHAYTETSHLPENFLPDFLDLVVWGHEHECLINPRLNPEMNFRVMQPGSSVATSLVPGEAAPKQVALVTITGREFVSEPIRLRSVRPFVYKDIVLSQEKEAVKIARKENHRTELTRFLMAKVEDLIEQALEEWKEAHEDMEDEDEDEEDMNKDPPLPLIRLRVETTPPQGVDKFDTENPQRFSNRFTQRVANSNDIIQFYAKKKAAMRKEKTEDVNQEVMSALQNLDSIKVDKLVREFLAAQSLKVLPQNYFGDAVTQYVDKDDKHAMELFVNESLAKQLKYLVSLHQNDNDANDSDEDELATQIDEYRAQLEELFSKGALKKSQSRLKPKPDNWDSDMDGDWADQPGALLRPESDAEDGAGRNDYGDDDDPVPKTVPARGRGRGRGVRGATTVTTRKPVAKTAAKKPVAKRRNAIEDSDKEDEDDVVMLDDDDEEDNSQAMFFKDSKTHAIASSRGKSAATASSRGRKDPAPAVKKPSPRSSATKVKQATLNFTNSQASVLGHGRNEDRSQSRGDDIDDDDDEDDDAFEPVSSVRTRSRR